MSRGRAPGAAQEQARRVVLHLLGSGNLRTILWAIALLMGIGWLTESLFEWLRDLEALLNGESVAHWWPLHRVVSVLFFAVIITWLGLLARDARKHYRPRVGTEPTPAPARGLVMFLSNLKPNQAVGVESAMDGINGLESFRRRLGDLNWRMPIEAIAFHQARLQQVVLICSRGERKRDGTHVAGSAEQLGLFRALVARIFPDAGFALNNVADLDSRYGGGLRFDDVDSVSRATDDAVLFLSGKGLPLTEILIDVTGGQKPNAVAATAVALAEGRRIQYVAGDPQSGEYRVTVYDVTYDQ